MNPEIFEGIAGLQQKLKDGIETHNGHLMALAGIGLRSEGVHLVRSNYTIDGVEMEIWYPFDKKTYTISIKEKSL